MSYKKIKDRNSIKPKCEIYMYELKETDTNLDEIRQNFYLQFLAQQQFIMTPELNNFYLYQTPYYPSTQTTNPQPEAPLLQLTPNPDLLNTTQSQPQYLWNAMIYQSTYPDPPQKLEQKVRIGEYEINNDEFIKIEQITKNLKRLHVLGEVLAEHGFLQRSDERNKNNINPIQNSLSKILCLTGRTFKYYNSTENKTGFIAQEVQKVFPDLVKEDSTGQLSIDILGIIPIIVEAIKEIHQTSSDSQLSTEQKFKEMSQTTSLVLQEIQDQKKRKR